MTHVYAAPEVLGSFVDAAQAGISAAADIWSIGCLVYDLLADCYLFPSVSDSTSTAQQTAASSSHRTASACKTDKNSFSAAPQAVLTVSSIRSMQSDTSCAAGSNQPSTSFAPPLTGTKRDASDCSCSEAESSKRHCVSADAQSAAASAHHEAQSCASVVSNHVAKDMDAFDVDGCDRTSNRDECDGSSAASVSSVDSDDDSDDDDDEAQMQHVMDQHRQWVSIAILQTNFVSHSASAA